MALTRETLWTTTLFDHNIHALEATIVDFLTELRHAEAHIKHIESASPSPIPRYEAEVQALRYLRGFLQIIKFSPFTYQREQFLAKLNPVLSQFHDLIKPRHQARHTYWLGEKLANIVQETLIVNAKDARKQITMARDLGVLVEDHYGATTVTESGENTTIQTSTIYHLRENQKIIHYQTEGWFLNAKQLAGFSSQANTWLDKFFLYNAVRVAKNGIPAPPSARWLPIPANVHRAEITVNTPNSTHNSYTSLIRMGTIVPLDMKVTDEQKVIAHDILDEIIKDNLENSINQYRKLYGFGQDEHIVFFVNYQTLLSPIPGEESLPHKDNNARFIAITKDVLKQIRHANEWQAHHPNITLVMQHTNTPLNKRANLSRIYAQDNHVRWAKISQTRKVLINLIFSLLIKNNSGIDREARQRELRELDHLQLLQMIKDLFPPPDISTELLNELTLRAHACTNLSLLLKHSPPFNGLQTHQRNIMMAALEFLTMGSQSLSIAGCKSARDRTAIFLSAVKTMQENSRAMHDWQTLLPGIINTLNEGHHFRTMLYHSAIVKVDAVHQDLFKLLASSTQKSVLELKPFSKNLKPYLTIYPNPANDFWSLFSSHPKVEPPAEELKEGRLLK